MIYFDHAASTPVREDVLDILNKSFREDFANPSAAHNLAKNLSKKIDASRASFLKFLNAQKQYDFYFTSSASESNNSIIKGIGLVESDHILYGKEDHPSVVNTVESAKAAHSKEINESTKLAILTHVNSQSGVLKDVLEEAAAIKSEKPNCWVHVDGVQAFGKYELSLENSMIDSYSISSHKISGPKGVAGLYIKKNKKVESLIDGGGQEHGFRSSTQPAPLIFAFELAASIAIQSLNDSFEKVSLINKKFQELLKEVIPQVKIIFENTSPYIFTFVVPKLPSDVMLRHLEQDSIYISSSSACSSKIKGHNPTFSALGIDEQYHKNVFRISFGSQNSLEEVDTFFEYFKKHYESMKFLFK